jgi:hypothetical protein
MATTQAAGPATAGAWRRSCRRRLRLAIALVLLGPAVACLPSCWWPPRPGPTLDLRTFASFPFDGRLGTIADVPAALRQLDGRRATVVGYAYLGWAAATGGGPCQLVGGFDGRLYRGPPMVQDRVFATVVPGRAGAAAAAVLNASASRIVVESTGVFHVGVEHDDAGNINSVFRLDVDSVRPGGTPVVVPGWVVAVRVAGAMAVAAGLALALGVARDRRRRRLARLGFCCPECGYDLRASTGRCPECGSVPS